MRLWISLLGIAAAVMVSAAAWAQTLEIKNSWRQGQSIVETGGGVEFRQARAGAPAAQWTIEKVRGTQIRLRNAATGAYLAGDASGRLFTTRDTSPGAPTTWWLQFMGGDPANGYRINFLTGGLSLHVQDGPLALGKAPENWWSAIWIIPGFTAAPSQQQPVMTQATQTAQQQAAAPPPPGSPQVFGNRGQGQPFQLTIPPGGRATQLIVYADEGINGLQLEYEESGTGQKKTTPLAGSATGEREVYEVGPGDDLQTFYIGWGADGVRTLQSVTRDQEKRNQFGTWFGSRDPGVRGRQAAVMKGQAFAGFTGQADTVIRALGILTQPGGGPAQQTPQRPVQTTPQQQAAADPGDDFNPFADGSQTADSAPATTPAQQTTSTVVRPIGGGAVIATQVTGNRTVTPSAPPPPPASAAALYEGVWVERDWAYREEGDGIKAPKQYRMPRYVTVAADGPNGMVIRYHSQPVALTPLTKTNDSLFTGSGQYAAFKASFEKADESYFMTLVGPNKESSGDFEMARIPDGTLARDRFNPNVLGERETRRGLYASSSTVKDWRMNFNSFDGLEMDLFDSSRGVKAQIFKQPGANHYALEDNMQENLPYGLRGFRQIKSSYRETEVMITNASEFRKGMSFNFGGGGSGGSPGSPSLAANYSYEKSQGSRNSQGSFQTMGIGRMQRYVLITDLPSMRLSDGFRADIEKLVAGTMTPAVFVDRYGTHYANSVTYGALNKAEKTMTTQEIASFMEEKWNAGGSASGKGASLEGGYGETTGSSERNDSMFSRAEFEAVGGIGATSAAGHSVGDNDTVPIRYDLYPLSDLISPIFFPAGSNIGKLFGYAKARVALKAEIDRRMESAPPVSDQNIGPRIYRVEFQSINCTYKGDEGGNQISVYGKIAAIWHSDSGVQNLDIFSEPNAVAMSCGAGSAARPIGKSALIVLSRNTEESRKSGFGYFALVDSALFEDDDSVFDTDDKIVLATETGRNTLEPLSSFKSGQVTDFYFGGGANVPSLTLKVRITELK